jgi:hypothetical protein
MHLLMQQAPWGDNAKDFWQRLSYVPLNKYHLHDVNDHRLQTLGTRVHRLTE